jgi:Protein O-mannosyl-transferase TMEM260-like
MGIPHPRAPRGIETKIYPTVTAIALVGGFADLARGGTSAAAWLLSIAYCVLIPLAIWRWGAPAARARTPTDRAARPSYGAALGVGAAVLGLYLVTLARSTAMWDTSEYIAAAYTFGLPHPPGNPFFVIVGHLFSMLPLAPSVATRVNILAALSSAVAAAFWFLVTEQIVGRWLDARWLRLVTAGVGALIGATAFTVWNQSVVNEKVYTVSLMGIAIISWLAVRWSAHPDGPRADRHLVLIAYLCGLGYANHMAGMLPAPAIALAVIANRPRTLLRWPLLLACLAAIVIGLTPFATQPIRAAYFPALNEGEPTACRTEIRASCTFSAGTFNAFMYNVNRGQYGKPSLSERQAPFSSQVGTWWMYFKWQWFRDARGNAPFVQALLAATFLVLGVTGGWVHWRRDRSSFWYFGTLMFTTSLLLVYYLNFKLGASQDPASPQPHEVRDRDYFFIWSFSSWGIWAALGLAYAWEAIAGAMETTRRRGEDAGIGLPTRYGWRRASPILALALIPAIANYEYASRSAHTATRGFAADLLNSVEPYGVLVTVGDNDTFPLWYAQEVEGIRRDVVVACTSLLNTDWYVRQLIRRPVYEYDAARGPAIYRDRSWPRPAAGPLRMTMTEADSVPAYYVLDKPMHFVAPGIDAIIDPHALEYGVLQRSDVFVLRMIHDAWPARPVYFARTSASYARDLGLGDHVLAQGLAAKLFVPTTSPAAMTDTVYVGGDGWLDLARSRALWDTVFTAQKAFITEGEWIDRPSVGIPFLYVATAAMLSSVLESRGAMNEARQMFDTARRVAIATGLEQYLWAGAPPATPQPARGDSAVAIPIPVVPPSPVAAPSTREAPAAHARPE